MVSPSLTQDQIHERRRLRTCLPILCVSFVARQNTLELLSIIMISIRRQKESKTRMVVVVVVLLGVKRRDQLVQLQVARPAGMQTSSRPCRLPFQVATSANPQRNASRWRRLRLAPKKAFPPTRRSNLSFASFDNVVGVCCNLGDNCC